jgi:hypothetical protein
LSGEPFTVNACPLIRDSRASGSVEKDNVVTASARLARTFIERRPHPVRKAPIKSNSRLRANGSLRSPESMDDGGLNAALDRAEQALERIGKALGGRQAPVGRDEELRAKVREVVEELDELIRQAAA